MNDRDVIVRLVSNGTSHGTRVIDQSTGRLIPCFKVVIEPIVADGGLVVASLTVPLLGGADVLARASATEVPPFDQIIRGSKRKVWEALHLGSATE